MNVNKYQKCLKGNKNYKDSFLKQSDIKNVIDHSLKYLIVLNQKKEELLKQIENLKNNNSCQITSHFTEHRITALHIAVMKGCKEIVSALIEAKADINVQDKYGWTPLHHAILVSNELVQSLLEKKADGTIKTYVGGTYLEIQQLTAIKENEEPLFYQKFEGQVEKYKKTELSEHLEIEYVDEYFWPKEHHHLLWTAEKDSWGNSQSQLDIRKIFHEFNNKKSFVVLKEQRSNYFEVISNEKLEYQQLIGEYTGEIIIVDDKDNREFTYAFILEKREGYTVFCRRTEKR